MGMGAKEEDKGGDGGRDMKLGTSYNLAFYAKQDITYFIKDLFECGEVKELAAENGTRVFIGTRGGKVRGVALVEKDEEDPGTYLVKVLNVEGEVQEYVVFLGEKVILREPMIL